MKTVLQELIQWTIENAFNIEAQDGTTYIAIDHEEMRTKFDEWLQRDKEQSRKLLIGFKQWEVDNDIKNLLPEQMVDWYLEDEAK